MADETMHCTSCGKGLDADSRFCKSCGTAVSKPTECGDCGAGLDSDAAFCRLCGKPVPGAEPTASRAAADPVPVAAAVAPVLSPEDVAPARPRRQEPPPPVDNKSAVWVGVAVVVLAFGWLIAKKDSMPVGSAPTTAKVGAPAAAAASAAAPAASPYGAGGAAVPATAPGPAPVAAAGDGAITGTIRVAEQLADGLPSGGSFFVIARAASSPTPMPVAVAKLDASPNPTPFRIGPEDVMGQGTFGVGPFNITVKWDQDGSVGGQPGDLQGEATGNPVQPGAANVEVVLTRRL